MFLKRLKTNNNTPCLLPFLSSWTFSFPHFLPSTTPTSTSSSRPPPAGCLPPPSLLSGVERGPCCLLGRGREGDWLRTVQISQGPESVSLSLSLPLFPPPSVAHHTHAHAHTYTHTHTRKHSKLGPAATRLLQSLQKASERPPVRAQLTGLRLRARSSAKSRCPARPLRPGVPENKAGREGTDRSENTPATHAATSALAGSPRGDGAGSALRG